MTWHGTHGMTSWHLDRPAAKLCDFGLARMRSELCFSLGNDESGVFLPVCSESSQVPKSVFSSATLDKPLPTASFKPYLRKTAWICLAYLGTQSQVLGPCSGQALPPTWLQPRFSQCLQPRWAAGMPRHALCILCD